MTTYRRKMFNMAIAFLTIALTMFAAEITWSQATTCDALGFDHGCKVDPPIDGVYDCAAREVDTHFTGDGPKMLEWFGGPFDGVFIKGGPTYAEYLYDPPSNGDTGLTAPQNKDISHVLFCYNEEEPPVIGSCCFECDEPGTVDECEDDWTQAACEEDTGTFSLSSCEQRDDCDDFCPPEVTGACCAGYGDCVNEMTEEQCAGTGEGWIWYEDTDCEDVVCDTPVPTMNQWYLIALGIVLAIAGVFGVRRFVDRFERMGPFR